MRTARALTILLIVTLPFLEGGGSPAGLFAGHTLVFALMGAAVAGVLRRRRLRVKAGWEFAAAVGLLVVCLASFAGVDYLYGSFLSVWNVIVFVLLGLALVLLDDGRRRAWEGFTVAFTACGAAQAAGVLLLAPPRNLTPSGSFANASQLAAYLSIGIFIAAAKVVDGLRRGGGRRTSRGPLVTGAWLLAVLLDLAALLVIGARGALIAVILIGAVWTFSSIPADMRRLRAALSGVLLLLLIAAGVSFIRRFERIEDPYRYDRLRIWKAGLRAAAQHPILGMGPGMFERRGYRYNFPQDRQMFRFSKTPSSTHSTFLQALVVVGAAGLLAVLVLVFLLVTLLWRRRREGVVFGLYACLVQALWDTPFDVPAITMSLLVLVVPLLVPARVHHAPLLVSFSGERRRAVRLAALGAGVLGVAYLGAVLLPYAAHASFLVGLKTSRAGAASAWIDRAIVLEPYNPLYPATRADLAWRHDTPLTPELFARVHRDLEAAHQLDPGSTEFLVRLAQLHSRAVFELRADEASIGRAIALYRSAIALGREDPRPMVELGALLLAFGRRQEGIEEFSRALELEPRFIGARLALTRALLEIGRTDEAASSLRELERVEAELKGYAPRNGYEADLMRLDRKALAGLVSRLG